MNDVRCALANASGCEAADDGRWRVRGHDLDGDDLTCVVAIEDAAIVVTIF